MKSKTDLELITFEYPWMLCCLYHDVFSQYEKEGYEYVDLDGFCRKFDIQHTIYDMKLPEEISISSFEPTYRKTTIEQYFLYRMKNKRVDHGIAAGYILFDRLVKNYLEHRDEHKADVFTTNKDGHTLLWHKDQIWVFALAADAVIAHNIWHLDSEALPDEIRQGGEGERKLTVDGNPLAFVCAVVDSLEPVKRFDGQLAAEKVLENVFIKVGKNPEIQLAWSNTIKQQSKFFEWMENISGMTNWLQIDVSSCKRRRNCCYITIDF